MNRRMLVFVLGVVGLLVMAGLSQAYDFQYNQVGIWLLGGGTLLRKGFVTNHDEANGNLSSVGPTVKFGLNYRPIPLLGFGFDLNAGSVKNKTYPLPSDSGHNYVFRDGFGSLDGFLSLNFQQFIPSRKVNPYITLGGGATMWRATQVEKDSLRLNGDYDYVMNVISNGDTVKQMVVVPSMEMGMGLEIYIIRAIALNLNVTYHELFLNKDKYVMLPGHSSGVPGDYTIAYDPNRDMKGGGALDFSGGFSFYGVSSAKPLPPTGSIAGRVKDKDGNLVEGATVEFSRTELAAQTTGKDGKYAVSSLALGPITVKVSKDKYLPNEGAGTIKKNKIDTVDVVLEKKPIPKAILAGKISDQDGKPIAMAKVAAGDASVSTDAFGSYKAEVTVPDSGEIATVNATADGYKPKQATVALKPGQPEARDFTLVSATLKIKLVVLFRTGRADIEDYGDIDKAAKLLKDNPEINVEIAGYTDSRGSRRKNYKLSQDRADAVKQALVYRGGIEPTRIVAKGYGPDNPVAPNTTKAGRALNRRIELHVT